MKEVFIVDLSPVEEKDVTFMRSKRSYLGQAMKQCLLARKGGREKNDGVESHGFFLSGWQCTVCFQ